MISQSIQHPGLEPVIRPASYGDLDAIIDLWEAMMDEHQRSDHRIRLADSALPAYRSYVGYHLSNSSSSVLVAERGGVIVGFCLVTITRNLEMFLPKRYGYLSDLYVAPASRRRGLGRELVRREFEWLAQHDVHSVQLQYYEFNQSGAAFWKSVGFAPYYTRMWLSLP